MAGILVKLVNLVLQKFVRQQIKLDELPADIVFIIVKQLELVDYGHFFIGSRKLIQLSLTDILSKHIYERKTLDATICLKWPMFCKVISLSPTAVNQVIRMRGEEIDFKKPIICSCKIQHNTENQCIPFMTLYVNTFAQMVDIDKIRQKYATVVSQCNSCYNCDIFTLYFQQYPVSDFSNLIPVVVESVLLSIPEKKKLARWWFNVGAWETLVIELNDALNGNPPLKTQKTLWKVFMFCTIHKIPLNKYLLHDLPLNQRVLIYIDFKEYTKSNRAPNKSEDFSAQDYGVEC